MSIKDLDEKDSFLLYSSFDELYFSELDFHEKGILIDCIFKYVKDGRMNFEALENDRAMRISFRAIVDVINRNNKKWDESKERRRNAARKRWDKEKNLDTRTIEMPGDSSLVMTGNINNMPKDYEELKSRTQIANYEELRKLVDFCNFNKWEAPLEEMQSSYEDTM
ncbi:MAG: hypothetical protein IJD68_02210 [Ruminococcus sp.]|nr:hypothetical protein [Ruminococcus sp.]